MCHIGTEQHSPAPLALPCLGLPWLALACLAATAKLASRVEMLPSWDNFRRWASKKTPPLPLSSCRPNTVERSESATGKSMTTSKLYPDSLSTRLDSIFVVVVVFFHQEHAPHGGSISSAETPGAVQVDVKRETHPSCLTEPGNFQKGGDRLTRATRGVTSYEFTKSAGIGTIRGQKVPIKSGQPGLSLCLSL